MQAKKECKTGDENVYKIRYSLCLSLQSGILIKSLKYLMARPYGWWDLAFLTYEIKIYLKHVLH